MSVNTVINFIFGVISVGIIAVSAWYLCNTPPTF